MGRSSRTSQPARPLAGAGDKPTPPVAAPGKAADTVDATAPVGATLSGDRSAAPANDLIDDTVEDLDGLIEPDPVDDFDSNETDEPVAPVSDSDLEAIAATATVTSTEVRRCCPLSWVNGCPICRGER